MPSFGVSSKTELAKADERLQRVFNEVIKHWDCTIVQTKRTEEEATETQVAGTSHTKHSKHVYPLGMPALAADVTPYPINWKDTNRMYAFAGFVIGTAASMGIKLRWGGDWDGDRDLNDQTFNDLPHFELVD